MVQPKRGIQEAVAVYRRWRACRCDGSSKVETTTVSDIPATFARPKRPQPWGIIRRKLPA